MTHCQSIEFIDGALLRIEELIGKLMGITPSAEGQFVSKDPVANVRMSNGSLLLLQRCNMRRMMLYSVKR